MATLLKMELTDRGAVFQVGETDVGKIAASAAVLIDLLGAALEDSKILDDDGNLLTAAHFVCAVFLDLAAGMIRDQASADGLHEIINTAADSVAKMAGSTGEEVQE